MTPIPFCSAYFECIGGGGILEWNTVNDSYVALHPIIGVLTGAPADDIIFVGSNVGSRASIIIPGGRTSFLSQTIIRNSHCMPKPDREKARSLKSTQKLQPTL